MNKLTFILLLISTLLCRITYAQINFSIKTGLHLSYLTIDSPHDGVKTSLIPGVPVGISADIKLYKRLFLQPSACLSHKGFESDNMWVTEDFKAKVSYLEFPINIIYKYNVGSGNVIIGFGTYLAYGRKGKWTTSQDAIIGDINLGRNGEIIFTEDASYRNYDEYVYGKAKDYGGTTLIGYEILKKILIQLNSSIGLRDINSDWTIITNPFAKKYNRTFGLTFGYIF